MVILTEMYCTVWVVLAEIKARAGHDGTRGDGQERARERASGKDFRGHNTDGSSVGYMSCYSSTQTVQYYYISSI